MSNKKTCPLCGVGKLDKKNDLDPTTYKGVVEDIVSHFSECDSCGCVTTDYGQSRLNKRAFLALKKRVDGLLSGSEIKNLRKRYNLKQSDAAKMFGGGPVAFSKYESDDVVQSESMDKLLRVAFAFPEVLAQLAKDAEVDIPAQCESDLQNYMTVYFKQLVGCLKNISRLRSLTSKESRYFDLINLPEFHDKADDLVFDTSTFHYGSDSFTSLVIPDSSHGTSATNIH